MTVGSLLRKPSGADKTNPNNPKLQGTKKMKQIVSFKMISFAALLALTIGCASTSTSTQNRENMLVASGFKMITPKTTAQQQKLQNLPPGKVTMIQKGGKTYYVFPDPAHNRAHVGRPREYQAYQQLRATNKLVAENLETAEMYQDAEMQWSVWGGWDAGFGSFGPMAGPEPY